VRTGLCVLIPPLSSNAGAAPEQRKFSFLPDSDAPLFTPTKTPTRLKPRLPSQPAGKSDDAVVPYTSADGTSAPPQAAESGSPLLQETSLPQAQGDGTSAPPQPGSSRLQETQAVSVLGLF
jgi:hypothetical protein